MISAPSGAGKSTIIKALRKRLDDLGYSISHTSRKPRGGEKEGVDYFFVDRETFQRLIDAGAFMEWAEVYHDFYGTSFSGINDQIANGLDVVLDVDIQGAKNIRRHFNNSVLIYLLPPSLRILEKRLKDRGTDDEGVIETRTKEVSQEIKNCEWYDYIVVNEDLETAVKEIQSIIISERCRTGRRMPTVKKIFGSTLAL